MRTLTLCLTLVSGHIAARPYLIRDQWKLIDGGKRWKQTAWYSDGSRKCFIIEIPAMK